MALTFSRTSEDTYNFPRVVAYVNIRLKSFYFSLYKDIINHRDILLISFFNNNNVYFLLNIYSDSSYSALKYLKDTEVNIHNVLIITGDFNICNSLWDSLFSHYSHISNNLFILANVFNLELSHSIDQITTRYSDNCQELNSVINLIFLWSSSTELDNHSIHPK